MSFDGAEARRQRGADQLGLVILRQAPRQDAPHGERIGRRPRGKGGAEHLQLEQPASAELFAHHRVHAIGVALQGRTSGRADALPFGVRGGPQAECSKPFVGGHRRLAQQFRQPSVCRATIELHLPEPIPRVDRAHRKPRIVRLPRVHVRDAPRVGEDFHGPVEPGHRQLAVLDGE
jgi:hypothetical protein